MHHLLSVYNLHFCHFLTKMQIYLHQILRQVFRYYAKVYAMKLPKARKRGDAYRIEIMIDGKRFSATRDTARECEQWASQKILEYKAGVAQKKTISLKALFDLYFERVAKKRKTAQEYKWFFSKFVSDYPWLANKQVHEITAQDLTQYRDSEMLRISQGSVNRALGVLSPVFTFAVKELFIIDKNPLSSVVRLKENPPRNRRISDEEIEKILEAADYQLGTAPRNTLQYVAWAFVFAIKTCMRRGEIWGIKKEHINERYIYLPMTKNGSSRHVPLSDEAQQMIGWLDVIGEHMLPQINEGTVSAAWTRLTDRSRIDDLHFHDSRHEAISRFVRDYKIPVESLAKITGHKDLKILLNTYYNPTPDELADWLIKKGA